MNKILIIGGTNGIGSSLVNRLNDVADHIYVVGRTKKENTNKITYFQENLINLDFSFLNYIPNDIDTLIITAGIGRIDYFQNFTESEIQNYYKINTLTVVKLIKHFYNKILKDDNFNCCVISSIAGHISSPLLSVYGSSKAAVSNFIESINIELIQQNSKNRILDVSPGFIEGTSFYGKPTEINKLKELTDEIINAIKNKNTILIPNEKVYNRVLENYKKDPVEFGINSFNYKIENNRLQNKSKQIIGYMSGSFDLFHIGHLNIIREAKKQCDYLIVGVHKDGSHKNKTLVIDFEDRKEIVRNIKYVDLVIDSLPEDTDAYDIYHINKLFVGTDYKGSEKFKRYEEYLKDKDAEIIYIPYTQKCNSTELREKLKFV